MNFLKNNKGVARVIEAFLASILLMSCLSLVPVPPSNMKNPTENLVSTANNILLSLDTNGYLATIVDGRNWTTLKECVESALPLTTWFNLTVFDQGMNTLNPFPISNAGALNDKVISVDYICVSQNSNYTIYVLRLQLSELGST
jgi:hypothetical protein